MSQTLQLRIVEKATDHPFVVQKMYGETWYPLMAFRRLKRAEQFLREELARASMVRVISVASVEVDEGTDT